MTSIFDIVSKIKFVYSSSPKHGGLCSFLDEEATRKAIQDAFQDEFERLKCEAKESGLDAIEWEAKATELERRLEEASIKPTASLAKEKALPFCMLSLSDGYVSGVIVGVEGDEVAEVVYRSGRTGEVPLGDNSLFKIPPQDVVDDFEHLQREYYRHQDYVESFGRGILSLKESAELWKVDEVLEFFNKGEA